MANQDFTAFLEPLAGPQPAGRDLDTSLDLLELESAASEPEEAAFKGIETVDNRNWAQVRSRAEKLLGESKDVRVVVILARAQLHTRGVAAFCGCVSLMQGLLQRFWAEAYPQRDEEGDVIARLNALRELWSPVMLTALRDTKLASVRGMGDFTVRDVLIARGKDTPRVGAPTHPPQLVLKALESAADAAATREALRTAQSALDGLVAFVRQEAPSENLDPAPLASILAALLGAYPDAQPSGAAVPAVAAQAGSGTAAVVASAETVYRERELRTREDVIALLDRICEYYAEHEPSSPIPLILQRARRLVPMNFLEIIRDLADKGLPQVEAITGKEPKS